jgi:hypothetical protein
VGPAGGSGVVSDHDMPDRESGTTSGAPEWHELTQVIPRQRRSGLRCVLAGHGGERPWRMRDVAAWLPPETTRVTTDDDAALIYLSHVEWPDYWFAARGVSDAAVDALADRIGAAPLPAPGTPGPLVARYRPELLTGIDTDHALARLADRSTQPPYRPQHCGACQLAIVHRNHPPPPPAGGPCVTWQ